MKRQELHNYIRKEIINELTEDAAADKAAQDAEKIAVDKKIAALNKKKSELNKGPASSLAEMARIPNKIKLGDPEKVEIAKEAYAGSEIEKLIDFVKEAGEEGITQDESYFVTSRSMYCLTIIPFSRITLTFSCPFLSSASFADLASSSALATFASISRTRSRHCISAL